MRICWRAFIFIEAVARKGFDLSKAYVCYSGRMHTDMLIKVVRVGIPILVSNSAPAGSGYDIALKGNITMVGFARGDRFNVYTAQNVLILIFNQ